jgi:hypothetical protein
LRPEGTAASEPGYIFTGLILCCPDIAKYNIGPRIGMKVTGKKHITLLEPVNSCVRISIKVTSQRKEHIITH